MTTFPHISDHPLGHHGGDNHQDGAVEERAGVATRNRKRMKRLNILPYDLVKKAPFPSKDLLSFNPSLPPSENKNLHARTDLQISITAADLGGDLLAVVPVQGLFLALVLLTRAKTVLALLFATMG